jgi:RimJ/RimL family protein N-acetyltransferase
MIDQLEAITTMRLRLREPRANDAQRLGALANDFDVARMTTNIPHPYALADADAFLARMMALDAAREALFAIDHAEEGLIGVLGFHPTGPAPEVGYWIGRPYWGQGYATEALTAALGWAGRAWGKRWVVAGHFADNPASGRVLTKAGFLYTGVVTPQFSKARGAEAPSRMMVRLA